LKETFLFEENEIDILLNPFSWKGEMESIISLKRKKIATIYDSYNRTSNNKKTKSSSKRIVKNFHENVEDIHDQTQMIGKKINNSSSSLKCSYNTFEKEFESIEKKELSEYRRKEKNKKNKKYLFKSNLFKSVKIAI